MRNYAYVLVQGPCICGRYLFFILSTVQVRLKYMKSRQNPSIDEVSFIHTGIHMDMKIPINVRLYKKVAMDTYNTQLGQ